MKRHPNATVGLVSGSGIGTFVVWILAVAGVHVDAEAASAIAGGVAAFVLFVGRNGLRGVWRLMINGTRPAG